MSSRTSSTSSASSTSSNFSTKSGAAEYVLNDPSWPKVCRKNGAWYDCLRPVPGYQGFGSLQGSFTTSKSGRKPSEEDWNWTPEIKAKMSELKSEKAKGKKTVR